MPRQALTNDASGIVPSGVIIVHSDLNDIIADPKPQCFIDQLH
jgi:hypothetical protein